MTIKVEDADSRESETPLNSDANSKEGVAEAVVAEVIDAEDAAAAGAAGVAGAAGAAGAAGTAGEGAGAGAAGAGASADAGEAASAANAASASVDAATSEEAVMAEAEEVLSAVSELEAAKAEIEELKEKYLRLHAEWDTYRRRMNEQREEDKKRAAEKLVDCLIPVIDDFERTIDYATNNGEAGMLEGTQAVLNKLVDALNKSGVEVLNPQGQAFNALEAQAVQMVEDTSVPDETVAQVFQKGYRMGTKVLRPAMVVVTSGGPAREPEAEQDKA